MYLAPLSNVLVGLKAFVKSTVTSHGMVMSGFGTFLSITDKILPTEIGVAQCRSLFALSAIVWSGLAVDHRGG